MDELPEWPARPRTLEEFARRIEAVGLSSYLVALSQLARHGVQLVPDPALDTDALGTTRLGGEPDLPSGTAWPTKGERPLSFILQVDLADVAPRIPDSGLPSGGLLSFFYDALTQSAWGYDPNDRGSWAVIHSAPEEVMLRRPFPSELDESVRFRPLALSAVPELCFPSASSYEVELLGIPEYWSTYSHVLGDPEEPLHRMLGHADPVQGDMQRECQLASNGIYVGSGSYTDDPRSEALMAGSTYWRLLLEVDSSQKATGMMWGDMGKLYFWLTDQDLRSHRWDRAWMVLQCG